MDSAEKEAICTKGNEAPTYLDIQAAAGITKHMGGYPATDALYSLCRLEEAQEVLEVGCGIGVGTAYIAKRFDCRVMAVDISEKMLSWARRRARRESVLDRIAFRKAQVCELPFEDHRFDAVIVESVLAFVESKEAAIQELIRVTKPGGYLGLNECYWTQPPPPELLPHSLYIGPEIITEAEWRAIWERTSLEERTIQAHRLEAKQEVRDRIKWIGWRWILPAWGRVLKLLITNPGSRDAIKEQLDAPTEMVNYMGYALFVGRKPR
jgi:ubiquinone/menaquinone biosynthesis C-methylase UbiE